MSEECGTRLVLPKIEEANQLALLRDKEHDEKFDFDCTGHDIHYDEVDV